MAVFVPSLMEGASILALLDFLLLSDQSFRVCLEQSATLLDISTKSLPQCSVRNYPVLGIPKIPFASEECFWAQATEYLWGRS